jgi:DNA polymerase-3 subunit chi
VQVDFYQIESTPLEQVVGTLSEKVLASGGRLLVVASDGALLARLNRLLWDQGPSSFLPHALAGGADDARQPILLSKSEDAPNLARNIMIADGEWRDAALSFDRAFHLFDGSTVEQARLAWKLLSGREGVERRYWRQEGGRWVQAA